MALTSPEGLFGSTHENERLPPKSSQTSDNPANAYYDPSTCHSQHVAYSVLQMKRLFRKLQIRAYYWYLINTNDIKYSFLLDIYTKILPRKFKMDQKVVYKNHVWSVYYTGRSYRPYYYHLSRIGHGRFIYTSMAEEQDLKPLSPVMEAMYEGVDV